MANAAAVSQSPKPAAAAAPPAPPAPDPEASEVPVEPEPGPMVEILNMAGLVLRKTVHPDGECETETLKEPMIAPELVRATRASQRQRGH